MRGALLGALMAELAIITWRDVHQAKILPLPSDYVAAVGVYATLGAIAHTDAAPLATAVGWVIVWATLTNLWNPQSPTALNTTVKKAPTAQPAAAK